MKKEIKIQSTFDPDDRKKYPTITAINNADRRRAFNRFNQNLLNRILDIKNQMI